MTDEPIPRRPIGTPVAEALLLPDGRITAALQNALDAVTQVHGDGALPRIPVVENAMMRKEAEYTRNTDGQAVQIAVNPRSAQVGLSFLHEIGHFIEPKGIGLGNVELLTRFHQRAGKTDALRTWGRLARRRSTLVTLPNGLSMWYNL